MINLNERDDVVVVMGKFIKEPAQRREFETNELVQHAGLLQRIPNRVLPFIGKTAAVHGPAIFLAVCPKRAAADVFGMAEPRHFTIRLVAVRHLWGEHAQIARERRLGLREVDF